MMSHLSKDILGDAGVGAGVGGEHRGDQVHVGVPWRGCCLGTKVIMVLIVMIVVNLDEGDGEVVRGGVEPLYGGDHAAVVHCAQELRLYKDNFVKS